MLILLLIIEALYRPICLRKSFIKSDAQESNESNSGLPAITLTFSKSISICHIVLLSDFPTLKVLV
ncbi:hypothetical protein, partial [Salmonella enterica]|uniref:hypothetical protein n=1 Tax=Salmonella enterica TaxID=28901 RepID=UPI001CB71FF1